MNETIGIYKSTENISLGEKIRMVRKSAGLTQEQLAERLGVTKSSISLHETNKTRPRKETITKFANALKVPVEFLTDSKPDDQCLQWVSIKERTPESENGESLVHCIVNVVRQNRSIDKKEFVAPAVYNQKHKTFTVYDLGDSTTTNLLFFPDYFDDNSGFRITHWRRYPAPVSFWKEWN